LSVDLSSIIAATAQWLVRAYPPAEGAMNAALAEAQARQAVTVAAWLRYPTVTEAALVAMAGPGGSARLEWMLGGDLRELDEADFAWRSWVDETVASWAAALLTSPALADAAVAALAACEHTAASPVDFRRLTAPDDYDRKAAPLLRHPDLLAPVADLHHAQLLERLHSDHMGVG
jgi:MoxR-like ATPase